MNYVTDGRIHGCEVGSFEANPESLLKKLTFNHRGGYKDGTILVSIFLCTLMKVTFSFMI